MSPKHLSDSRKIPLISVGTIPDFRNNSGLPETLSVISDSFSGDHITLFDHSLDALTCHHTLKCVTLGFGITPDMVETISLVPIITVGSWATAVIPGYPQRQHLFIR